MRFAFCLFNYFPFGGLQRDFLRIARECIRKGHRVDVYTMSWEGEYEAKLPVFILPTKGFQNHTRRYYFVKNLQATLKNKQYDLIVGFNKMPGLDVYYAADTCFQTKARQQRGAWYRLTPRYRQLITFEKSVFAKTSSTQILLLSKLQQTEFMQYYHTPPHRFHFLPPGITKDRIAPDNKAALRAALRHDLKLQENDFLLLLVGSGFKTKGLDRVLYGMTYLSHFLKQNAYLVVIGKDDAHPFERLTKKLNLTDKVRFLGGRDDVPQFMLAADLLLHPAYNENTGTVLLEALVAGLPVLTTDVCGYAEYVVAASAGIVLPSPFEQAFFNKTLATMLTSSERATWQQNALHFTKQADIYNMPERAVNIIESLKVAT